MQVSSRSYLFFVEWVAKYIRFRNEPAHSHQACGLNRIYLATAKVGGILFEITPFGSPHRLLEDEKINIYANTFERYQFVTIVDHKKGRSCMLDQQICRNWGMFGQSPDSRDKVPQRLHSRKGIPFLILNKGRKKKEKYWSTLLRCAW